MFPPLNIVAPYTKLKPLSRPFFMQSPIQGFSEATFGFKGPVTSIFVNLFICEFVSFCTTVFVNLCCCFHIQYFQKSIAIEETIRHIGGFEKTYKHTYTLNPARSNCLEWSSKAIYFSKHQFKLIHHNIYIYIFFFIESIFYELNHSVKVFWKTFSYFC